MLQEPQELQDKLKKLRGLHAPTVAMWIWLPLSILRLICFRHGPLWEFAIYAFFTSYILCTILSHYSLRREVDEILTAHFPGWNLPPPPAPPKEKCGQCGIDLPAGKRLCRFCGWELPVIKER